jgi:tetratricopeptide (TPR) repeat protein
MTTADQALHIALDHQKSGRLDQARAIYQQILTSDPNNAHALHLLGTIAMHAGQPQAETLILAALKQAPDLYEARFNLAVYYNMRGRPAEALPLLERLLTARKDSTEPALLNLVDLEFQYANALRALGQAKASIPFYRKTLAERPDDPERLNNLGVALKDDGQFTEAAEILQRALDLQPLNAAAWTNLGSTWKELGKFEAAIDAHRHAIAVQPMLPQAHCNLANALQAAGRMDEAVAAFQTALKVGPDFAIAHYNFGNCLLEMGRLDQAVVAFLRAVTLDPHLHQALGNLGNALKHTGRLDHAIAVNRKAISLRPDVPEFHFNLALLLLLCGEIAEGWKEYEWRLQTGNYLAAHGQEYSQPTWDGSPLLGRSLFIHFEQGLGDTIQFVRYVLAVAATASPDGAPAAPGQIQLQIPGELMDLFMGLEHITLVEPDAPPPPTDLHIPIMSLPHVLAETVLGAAGSCPPYFRARPAKRILWRRRLADAWRAGAASQSLPQPRLRVGLVWAGARSNTNDKRRSISLAAYAPLARQNVQFVSLQVGQAAREIDSPPPDMTIFDASPLLKDMTDTADAIAELDLVITVDTAVAHLAGAMGKAVWLLIPRIPDFRWLLERTDSPWYPSMILFRQKAVGDWSTPIASLQRALDAVIAGARPAEIHKQLSGDASCGEHHDSTPSGPLIDGAHPRRIEPRDNAGKLCAQAEQFLRENRGAQAIAHAERALQIDPDRVDTLTLLGRALISAGRAADALAPLDHALKRAPELPEALNLRGMALAALGQIDAAVEAFEAVLRQRPKFTEARANLAGALADRGDFDAAIENYRLALAGKPDLAIAYFHLARCHLALHQSEMAILALDQSLRLVPGHAPSFNLLGTARSLMGQFEAADYAFRQAINLQPTVPEPHLGLAITLLVREQVEPGWLEYEWRRRVAGNSLPIRRDLPQPDWDGSSLDGRTILLHAEQGLGDTIQFCRYVPDVVARGGQVIFECPPPLRRLIEYSELGARVEPSAPPGAPARYYSPVDVQVPLLSLPRVLKRPVFGEGGKTPPYLRADPALIELWKSRLAAAAQDQPAANFRIGLVWAGGTEHPRDRVRSSSLAAFQPLATDGVQFVGLQVGAAANQIASAPSPMNILDITREIEDFADTAAIVAQLDLVITVDTAVAHLAGALGKPVWVLLPTVPDFRWLLGRADTPWYPTMRLFRQSRPGDWSDPIAAAANRLKKGSEAF